MVVIRVEANTAPRPLLIDLKAPIRLSGQNSTADRDRLLRLAREEPAANVLPMGQGLMAPHLNSDDEGKPAEDFVLRTGTNLPMGEAAAWRPLSERSVECLARVLNESVLPGALRNLGVLTTSVVNRPQVLIMAKTSGVVEVSRCCGS
ncbi:MULTISPECIES: hypothetical protein [Streptomyces]|uniref:hypothetical protein n=1 Tax=Streptomyces TaxID=1883 RepID=UPI0016751B92|nr:MULTISPECIES: hypothetical protein [Streptomyces]MBD3580515.1 hypothetical protein [Streptomyces sp. KD18]GGT30432.1 hypothetical protein GCM10010286_64480 [Streptomyces toxytricini]